MVVQSLNIAQYSITKAAWILADPVVLGQEAQWIDICKLCSTICLWANQVSDSEEDTKEFINSFHLIIFISGIGSFMELGFDLFTQDDLKVSDK